MQRFEEALMQTDIKQERFLPCQTPTSTVRLKVEGCSVKNWGSKNKSEELAIGVLDLE